MQKSKNSKLSKFQKEKKKVDKHLGASFTTLSTNNETANQSRQAIVSIPSLLNNVNRCASGIISYAISKGYEVRAEDPSFPFFAMVYLCEILINAMQSSGYIVQTVPRWLANLIHALNPKKQDMNTGSITFTWAIDFDGVSSQWIIDLGPLGLGRHVNFGVVDTASYLNTLFPSVVVPPTPYTPELGAQAWTSVLNYLKNYDSALTDMIGVAEPNKADNDASAFATCIKYVGGAGDANGAFYGLRELEVPIHSPMYGCFAKSPQNIVDGSRAPNFAKPFSGDALFLGGVLCSTLPKKLVKGQTPPVFGPIDLLEFVDVLAKWCSSVCTEAASDYQNQNKEVENVTTFTVPLTLQEVTLLLRNTILQALNQTQFAVQGIYPSENTVNNPFLPFVVGVGTHPVPSTPMLLPQLLVENIRNLTYKVVRGKGNESYLPVLGVYADDQLNWKDYRYHVTDYGDYQTFIDPSSAYAGPAAQLEHDKKTISVKGNPPPLSKVGAEQPVDIVTGLSGGTYYAINDLNALNILAARWNEWVVQIKPFSMTLTSVAADGGIAVANCIDKCDLITFDDLNMHGATIDHKRDPKMPSRLTKSRASEPTLYANRKYYATVSRDPFLDHVWGILQQYYIRPRMRYLPGPSPATTMSLDKLVNYRRNPYTIVPISGDPVSLDIQHELMVSLMVRPRNGGATSIEMTIQTLESQYGRAGILSSLFGPIIKGIAPSLSGVVDTVGGFLP